MAKLARLIILCLLPLATSAFLPAAAAPNVFDVTAYGAVGDAKTNDNQAFLSAWAAACAATLPTSTLLIPSNKTFLLTPITFNGPCAAQNINIQLSGNLIAPGDRQSYGAALYWLTFQKVTFLTAIGSGYLEGRGSTWWPNCPGGVPCKEDVARPGLMIFEACNNLSIKGWKMYNSPRNHIQIYSCNNVYISNIEIYTPGNTINTDGINVGWSNHIAISDSYIGSGDDCISFLSGVSDANVTSIFCGPGHGISIGSLGIHDSDGYVSQVKVVESVFNYTQNGLRIKTWQGGSGYVKDVMYRHIRMYSVENPIVIDQYYFDKTNKSSAIAISNVDYYDITGSGSGEVVMSLACSLSVPCRNITLNRVNLHTTASSGKASTYCLKVDGPPCTNCSPNPQIPCLG